MKAILQILNDEGYLRTLIVLTICLIIWIVLTRKLKVDGSLKLLKDAVLKDFSTPLIILLFIFFLEKFIKYPEFYESLISTYGGLLSIFFILTLVILFGKKYLLIKNFKKLNEKSYKNYEKKIQSNYNIITLIFIVCLIVISYCWITPYYYILTFPLILLLFWQVLNLKSNLFSKINITLIKGLELLLILCLLGIMILIEIYDRIHLHSIEANDHIFDISHILFEVTPIFLTFYIFYAAEKNEKYKINTKDDNKFYETYLGELKKISKSLTAVNIFDDYSLFKESTGDRYLTEQYRAIHQCEDCTKNHITKICDKCSEQQKKITTKKRFFIVDIKDYEPFDLDFDTPESFKLDYDSFANCNEIIAIQRNESLSNNQRHFKSLVILNELFNVKTYLIPKKEIELLLKKENLKKKKLKEKKIKYEDLDRLIIDSTFWLADEKEGNLEFISKESCDFLNKTINQYSRDKYLVYNIRQKLKEIEKQKRDKKSEISY